MGNLHKIDMANMVDQLTKKPEVVSIFNNITEESEIKTFFFPFYKAFYNNTNTNTVLMINKKKSA